MRIEYFVNRNSAITSWDYIQYEQTPRIGSIAPVLSTEAATKAKSISTIKQHTWK